MANSVMWILAKIWIRIGLAEPKLWKWFAILCCTASSTQHSSINDFEYNECSAERKLHSMLYSKSSFRTFTQTFQTVWYDDVFLCNKSILKVLSFEMPKFNRNRYIQLIWAVKLFMINIRLISRNSEIAIQFIMRESWTNNMRRFTVNISDVTASKPSLCVNQWKTTESQFHTLEMLEKFLLKLHVLEFREWRHQK